MNRDGKYNLKLTVAYDGTNYHGFQRQANALTIQQVLEEGLSRLFGHEVKVTGAARTDAGVHAYGQTVNFYTAATIPVEKVPLAARAFLPPDIVVVTAERVPHSFHARYSAQSKIYRYQILNSPQPDPCLRNYSWHIPHALDIDRINEALGIIVGTHDFSSFRAAGGAPVNPVRTIYEASCARRESILEFRFWGNGFLYHMVRNLVGTLVDVGRHKLTIAEFAAILAAKDRTVAGITAPPQGLFLQRVLY